MNGRVHEGRRDAGQRLAQELSFYADQKVVVAVPTAPPDLFGV
jgi:hypothetical protein